MIEAFVRHGEPFHFVAQHLVPTGPQHPHKDIVQLSRVFVNGENGASGLRPYPKGGDHSRGCLLPSRAVGGFDVVFGGSRWGRGRECACGGPREGWL